MKRTRSQRDIVEAASRKYKIDPSALWGVYGAETNFGKNVHPSSAGAQGAFQLMPGTAQGLGVDPNNFEQAAMGAAHYLSQYKDRGVRGMLAAYNAGPAGNPNNPETKAYIPKVMQLAKTWGGSAGGAPAPTSSTPAASQPQGPNVFSILSGLQHERGQSSTVYDMLAGMQDLEEPRTSKSTTSTTPQATGAIQGKPTIGALAKLATEMGLTVREFEPYDKVDPVHAEHSLHYDKRAFDASGKPDLMEAFERKIDQLYGGSLTELFYNGPGGVNRKRGKRVPPGFVSGHKDHVHVGI